MDYKYWLLQRYYQWRCRLPGHWLYHADYFQVLDLLAAGPAATAAATEQRLRDVLSTAAQYVPFYQREVRLTPQQLANEPLACLLEQFPYISKAQVTDCPRDFLDGRRDPRELLYATSTGSTGHGIGVWRSKRLADIEKAFYTHEWAQYGFSFHKSRYVRIGADSVRLPSETPARIVGNRLLLSPYHLSTRHKSAIRAALNQFRPEYLHAYPSCAAALADLFQPGDLDFPLRAALLASEPVMPQQAAAIARLFACPISISYGMTERTNLAFSSCDGDACGPYRFQSLYGYSENRIVNGLAEIVGTSLWNDVMPLIRYCTGDFGLIDDHGICAVIDGRAQEFVVDRHGNPISGISITIDPASWEFVRIYQIRQSTQGAITLTVAPRYGPLTQDQRKQLLDTQLKHWGALFDIRLHEVDDIPLGASGKRRFVINELDFGVK
jgi:phenylacetate-CoA ligase